MARPIDHVIEEEVAGHILSTQLIDLKIYSRPQTSSKWSVCRARADQWKWERKEGTSGQSPLEQIKEMKIEEIEKKFAQDRDSCRCGTFSFFHFLMMEPTTHFKGVCRPYPSESRSGKRIIDREMKHEETPEKNLLCSRLLFPRGISLSLFSFSFLLVKKTRGDETCDRFFLPRAT